MCRILTAILLGTLSFTHAAYGAVAPVTVPVAADLFTISGIRVDATAPSPRAARDLAMAQGRPLAWNKLFRRFTLQGEWGNQPQLADNQLLGLILSVEARNERRSTTRYLADVIFHFNPNAVRHMLRGAGITFSETRSEPAVVIPLIAGNPSFGAMRSWASAWADSSLQKRLVPMMALKGDEANLLIPGDLTHLDWAALAPIVRRHNASKVIFAIASEDAKTVEMIEVSAMDRTASSFAFAQSTFAADVEAIVEKVADEWRQSADRERIAIDDGLPTLTQEGIRKHLMANVRFKSPQDFATIRSQLGAVDTVSEVHVVGLTLNEALIDLTFAGEVEELRRRLAQHYVELSDNGDEYWLDFSIAVAANSRVSVQ
jgi:hypothetical protein